MASNPNFPGVPRNDTFKLVNGSGTTAQTLLTASASGTIVSTLFAVNPDANEHDVEILVNGEAITQFTVPAYAGHLNGASVRQDVFDISNLDVFQQALNGDSMFWWQLGASEVVQVRAITTLPGAEACIVHAWGVDL